MAKNLPNIQPNFREMTGRVIDQALKEGYNIVVEGTFRTPETPIKTLNDMQQHGYQTAVYLQTAPSEVSWQGTLERYDEMVKAGETPRATPKEHHDWWWKNFQRMQIEFFFPVRPIICCLFTRRSDL